MEGVQRDVLAVLLERVFELGLISEATCRASRNSLASLKGLPEMFRDSARPAEEAMTDGNTQNTG